MTHYLRSRHDAILVGARTARVDDPALNCRYPSSSSSVLAHQPRPVIVDPRRRWDGRDTKVARLARERTGKAPWVVQRRGASCASEFLPEIGGLALCVGEDDDDDDAAADGDDDATRGRELSWEAILKSLKARGIDSVMVEGGATVMNALLGQPRLVDAVIVTIAPTFLGRGGVAVAPAPKTVRGERVNAAWIDETCWRQFGDDVVLCGRLRGGEDV
jgi:2,5-diamino-6-(ribosylamino)-4(3H)-pyrimidinone 5'-phosphate reductase